MKKFQNSIQFPSKYYKGIVCILGTNVEKKVLHTDLRWKRRTHNIILYHQTDRIRIEFSRNVEYMYTQNRTLCRHKERAAILSCTANKPYLIFSKKSYIMPICDRIHTILPWYYIHRIVYDMFFFLLIIHGRIHFTSISTEFQRVVIPIRFV